jgi:hypothetical protein
MKTEDGEGSESVTSDGLPRARYEAPRLELIDGFALVTGVSLPIGEFGDALEGGE